MTEPTGPYMDPIGSIVTELRAALTPLIPSLTVRGAQFLADDSPPIIIVDDGGDLMLDRYEVQRVRVMIRCYGRTQPEARLLWSHVMRELHQKGPRISNKDVAIYLSRLESASGSLEDPDVHWPYKYGSFLAYTAAQAVVASGP
jgi:hypothetical protein